MLVKELIEKLKEIPQDALIVVPGDGDFAVAEWVELEKKESADRFIEDANHTVVELVKHMK
jgi:hypothetical protein